MGAKKRSNIHSTEDGEIQAENNTRLKPLKKKIRKEKNEDEEKAGTVDGDGVTGTPSGVPSSSNKDMEKKKKRKAFDKERKGAALPDERGVQPKVLKAEHKPEETSTSLSSSSTNGLPEFHISVFKNLASSDGSLREEAVESLLTELQEVQKAYERLGKKYLVSEGLKLEADKDDGLSDCAPSLRYAVRRLIRGVSSSRECARQGFALGLTLLIGKISSIKVDALLKLIVDSLEISSSMKGQEARDCLLGRLFAYGALARSGRLSEEWISDNNTPYIKDFTSILISLAAKKRYLQEPAVAVLLDMIEKLPVEAVLNHVLVAPGLQEWFEEATDAGNPDALLLAIKIREKISVDSSVFGKLLPNPYNPSKVFAADHLFCLVNCLKESTFCQPRVHSIWPVLINILLPETVLQTEDSLLIANSLKKYKKGRRSSSSEEEVAKNIQCFYEVIIEGSLLLSSHDRKHLAFDIVLLLLPKLPASFIPLVLSYKFVQCLMDILSKKDSWLYKVSQHFLNELLDWVRPDDVRGVAVIVALQKHSHGKFDNITRTKTVKNLMIDFRTETGCMLFIQNLVNMFVDEGLAAEQSSNVKWGLEPCSLNSDQSQTTDDNSDIGSIEDKDTIGTVGNADFLKGWVIESLPSILKYLKLDPEAKFRVQKEVMKFLAVQGLFSASLGTEITSFELHEKFRWPKAATSTPLCGMCIEQLQLLLASAQKGESSQSRSNGLEPNDLGSYFMRFLSTLRNIPSVSLFRSLSEDDEKTFKKLQDMETRLSREERNCGLSADANKLHALRYLLIQLLLHVLLRPGEYSEAASELTICCKKAFAASSDLLGCSGEGEVDDEAMPELMDVLVDTLLSLLPQSSAPMRSAIEQVFKYFCYDVTDDGLLRMLRIVKKSLKPARHQDVDSEDHDDEDDEDFLGIEEDEEIDEAEMGETGESDEQTDDSEAVGGIDNANKELPEESDDSDGGMDDDAMFRMDTYLAQIFKEKKNQAGSETAQSQLVLFKLRVLSLLEIYLHENPGKPQVLTVYSNLAQAFINPHTAEGSEQLGKRIYGILQKKILKAKDIPKGEAVQLSILETLLEKNLKLASKPFKRKKSAGNPSKKQLASWNRYKMISSLAQNSTFWILKIIDTRSLPDSELQKVFYIFQTVMVEYFESKKSQIKSQFLKEIIRRRPWVGHHLLGFLLERCGIAKSEFRRVEALDLVTEILKSLVPLNSDESSSQDAARKVLKRHQQKLCHLIKELVNNMPEKQARRAEVRKFCGRIFQLISSHKLTKSFLKDLDPGAQTTCESKLGDIFSNLKNREHKW